jgi:hypothetical protein
MTVAWTHIRDLPSGEFAGASQSVIEGYIAEASRQLSEFGWGDFYDEGIKYLAAHLLAVMKAGSKGSAGPVTSERAGPVARSYAAAEMSSTEALSATTYGRRFMELRHMVAGCPRVL